VILSAGSSDGAYRATCAWPGVSAPLQPAGPFACEFADPQLYARALAATGPAFEAIQNVGEAAFHRAAVEHAGGGCGMVCRSGPKSKSWATWPANPKGPNAHDLQLPLRAPRPTGW